MVNVQLTDDQLKVVKAALRFIFDEIEDDMQFEKLIGSTRWEAEELLESLPVKGKRK